MQNKKRMKTMIAATAMIGVLAIGYRNQHLYSRKSIYRLTGA